MPETTEIQIEHHGAKTGVTGSCHQLHINPENSLLIDCGLFQGQEAGNTRNIQEIDFSIEGIQALGQIAVPGSWKTPSSLASAATGNHQKSQAGWRSVGQRAKIVVDGVNQGVFHEISKVAWLVTDKTG